MDIRRLQISMGGCMVLLFAYLLFDVSHSNITNLQTSLIDLLFANLCENLVPWHDGDYCIVGDVITGTKSPAIDSAEGLTVRRTRWHSIPTCMDGPSETLRGATCGRVSTLDRKCWAVAMVSVVSTIEASRLTRVSRTPLVRSINRSTPNEVSLQ